MAQRRNGAGPQQILRLCDLAAVTARLIRWRWLVGALILVATALAVRAGGLPLPEGALYGTAGAILLYNAALFWRLQQPVQRGSTPTLNGMPRLVAAQAVADWLALSLLVHLTGGITSPLIPLLLAYVLLLAGVLPAPAAWLAAGAATGGLAAVAALERSGWLPHVSAIPGLPPDLYRTGAFVWLGVGLFGLAAALVVLLAGFQRGRLRERDGRLVGLIRVAQAIASDTELQDLMNIIAQTAAEALGARGAIIRLLEEVDEDLSLATAYGLSEEYLEKGRVDLAHSRIDNDVLAGHPVFVHDVADETRLQYHSQVTAEGIRSILAVPVAGKGWPLGVLRVYAGEPGHFSPADAVFLSAIAAQGAAALESARARERLERADRERADFVRMVTHELRAPVGAAQSLLRTLLRGLVGELNERQQDMLQRIDTRLNMLLVLINDLLDLAATKTVDVDEPLKRVPLQPVLGRVVERMRHDAEPKQIEVEYDAPFEVLAVRGTEQGLIRIFDNLIGNAIKYTPPGGQVCVQVVERPVGAVISVSDTGMGIPAEDLPHLWRDFFRARNARQSGIVGTGLGLTIVKQLVDRFGGMISVRSVEGEGTTFKVTLPLATPADEPVGETVEAHVS